MQAWEEDLIPDDPVFPEDLAEIGFEITADDKIRCLKSPSQGPRYKINREQRINQRHMDTLHHAIHTIIKDRLMGMGMEILTLPISKGVQRHKTPVFVSSNISQASSVVVFIGEMVEDLGVFSYRDICQEGLGFGSVIKLAKWVLGESPESSTTALVIANPGARVWLNSTDSAVNMESFNARSRRSAASRARYPSARNTIQGNETLAKHTKTLFEDLLFQKMKQGSMVDVLGLSEGGFAALMYLNENWAIWKPHLRCIAVVNPDQVLLNDFKLADLANPQSFLSFLKDRGCGWILSDKDLGERELGLSTHGVNCFSGGDDYRMTRLVSRALPEIISWMNLMRAIPAGQMRVVVDRDEPKKYSRVIRAMRGPRGRNAYSSEKSLDSLLLKSLEGFVNDKDWKVVQKVTEEKMERVVEDPGYDGGDEERMDGDGRDLRHERGASSRGKKGRKEGAGASDCERRRQCSKGVTRGKKDTVAQDDHNSDEKDEKVSSTVSMETKEAYRNVALRDGTLHGGTPIDLKHLPGIPEEPNEE